MFKRCTDKNGMLMKTIKYPTNIAYIYVGISLYIAQKLMIKLKTIVKLFYKINIALSHL